MESLVNAATAKLGEVHLDRSGTLVPVAVVSVWEQSVWSEACYSVSHERKRVTVLCRCVVLYAHSSKPEG